jgi:hypothetical protein
MKKKKKLHKKRLVQWLKVLALSSAKTQYCKKKKRYKLIFDYFEWIDQHSHAKNVKNIRNTPHLKSPLPPKLVLCNSRSSGLITKPEYLHLIEFYYGWVYYEVGWQVGPWDVCATLLVYSTIFIFTRHAPVLLQPQKPQRPGKVWPYYSGKRTHVSCASFKKFYQHFESLIIASPQVLAVKERKRYS